jgi:hypothetical protein
MLKNNNDDSVPVFIESGYTKEIFLQSYLGLETKKMDKEKKLKLKNAIGKKYEKKKGKCDDFRTGLLIYDAITEKNGEVSKDLIPDNIYNDLINEKNNPETKDSNLSGYNYGRYNGTDKHSGITWNIGTYSLYGTECECWKYVSGKDYNFNEASQISDAVVSIHPKWSLVYTASKLYNCHSYTWINASSKNRYWLNDPEPFAETFDHIGDNCRTSNYDYLILRNFAGRAQHSARVTKGGSNEDNIITISKLGQYGVYSAPLSELMIFYKSPHYSVYR